MKKYIIAPAVGFVFMASLLTSCNSDAKSNSDENNQETSLTTSICTSERTVTEYTETAIDSVYTDYTESEFSVSDTGLVSKYSDSGIEKTESLPNISLVPEISEKIEYKPADNNAVQVTIQKESSAITEGLRVTESVHKTETDKTDAAEDQIKINEDGELVLPEVLF